MAEVIIYGTSYCGHCERAKYVCNTLGMTWKYKDISDKAVLRELNTYVKDPEGVPQIVWNGKYVGGYLDFVEAVESSFNNDN